MKTSKPRRSVTRALGNKTATLAAVPEPALNTINAVAPVPASRPSAPAVVHVAPYTGPLRLGALLMPSYVLANTKAVLASGDIERVFLGDDIAEIPEDSASPKDAKNGGVGARNSLKSQKNSAAPKGRVSRIVERMPRAAGDPWQLPEPILFRTTDNNAVVHGYEADVLVDIAQRYANAYVAGTLHHKQAKFGARAVVLVSALARAGITAAVYEATGFDKIKSESLIIDKIAAALRTEAGLWRMMFSAEFFGELARLYRLTITKKNRRPLCFAAFLREFFYEWFDADVYAELKRRNPRPSDGIKHHQHLTDFARSRFEQHQREVLILMRTSQNLSDFRMRFNAAYHGAPLQLELGAPRRSR